jgi:lipopolysaccharide/colanic/teichoic acid biosynthesis glycosyltransferase
MRRTLPSLVTLIAAGGVLFAAAAANLGFLGFGLILAGVAAQRVYIKRRPQDLYPIEEAAECNVLVVGTPEEARPYLQIARERGPLSVVAFVSADGIVRGSANEAISPDFRGTIERYLNGTVVDEVLVAASAASTDLGRIRQVCAQRGLTFRTIVRLPDPGIGRYRITLLGMSAYLLSVEAIPKGRLSLAIKRTMDLLGAIVGLCICGSIYIWYGFRIRKQSSGSVIFRQRRVGRNGRIFTVFKFRTMYADAEERLTELIGRNEMRGCMFKIADDPRATPIGKVLRRRHLDELPQFWNVLCGEMSLVGTRPPTPDEVANYQTHHRRRLSMKPGITGMWQTRGNYLINDFDEIVKLDCQYIDTWSVLLDCRIIARTLLKVLHGTGC